VPEEVAVRYGHGERGSANINGVLVGLALSRIQGQSPWLGDLWAKSPEARAYFIEARPIGIVYRLAYNLKRCTE